MARKTCKWRVFGPGMWILTDRSGTNVRCMLLQKNDMKGTWTVACKNHPKRSAATKGAAKAIGCSMVNK